MAKRKKKQYMGRIIFCLGIILKIIQIIGAAFGAEALSSSAMTLVTTCLLVGGLAVYAVEKLSVTSVVAALGAVSTLAGVMPVGNADLTVILMVTCFVCFGLMLISLKRTSRVLLGAGVLVIAVLIFLHSWVELFRIPAPLITILLIAVYAMTGIGVFL